MMRTRLTQARHEIDYDGSVRFELHYIKGDHEATVNVRMSINDGVEADCQELPADSYMDEMVLEEHAEKWAREHGSGFGEVEL